MAAREGPSALRLIERHPEIALLFTDVVLPGGMGGRELAREARARRPLLRVLYASGYSHNAVIQQGRLDPDEQWLAKPFSCETLSRKVRQVLDADAEQPTQQRKTGT
jgi:CheY-like chemotaxis protein